VTRLRVG